ncbi:hypothetical protein ZOSMA_12G00370 [Zostera marina]|uniref:Uncharacterized protein n=1 Tax=Zostera marina TaxID=29655 RepID=A0A0K9PZ62_ZOSMR|nr:hypothetical protein ZOSMA_12G00370 [Zostera marina]
MIDHKWIKPNIVSGIMIPFNREIGHNMTILGDERFIGGWSRTKLSAEWEVWDEVSIRGININIRDKVVENNPGSEVHQGRYEI